MMTGQQMPAAIGRQTVAAHAYGNLVSSAAELQKANTPLSRVKESVSAQIEALAQIRMNVAKA